MKNKKLIVLLIVTLTVIVLASIASRLRAPQSTITRQLLFPELAARINDVATITIKGSKGEVILQQQGDRWVLASADNYPALFNRIKQNVVQISELRIVDEKTDNPEFYERLGVEGPGASGTKSMLITLQDQSGQVMAGLITGHQRQSSSNKPGLYVRKPDAAQALLVEGYLDVSEKPSHWFETELFDIDSESVQQVRIRYPRSGEMADDDLVIHKDSREQPEFFINVAGLEKKPGVSLIANRISRGLEQMRGENVRALQHFTFPDNETFTTTVTTFDGLAVTARLVKKDRAHYASFTFTFNADAEVAKPETEDAGKEDITAPPGEKVSPAAMAETLNSSLSAWVYEIPDFLYEALTTRPDQLLKLKLMPDEV